MTHPVIIEPAAVYDDGALYALLGVTPASLAKGRESKTLRFSRKGHRVLYLGKWVLDWLASDQHELEGR